MDSYCICIKENRWEWNIVKGCFTCKYCGLFQDMKSFIKFTESLKN